MARMTAAVTPAIQPADVGARRAGPGAEATAGSTRVLVTDAAVGRVEATASASMKASASAKRWCGSLVMAVVTTTSSRRAAATTADGTGGGAASTACTTCSVV